MNKSILKILLCSALVSVFSVSTSLALWQQVFGDVRVGSDQSPTPYWAAINWASDKGVVQGYPDGTFRPNQCVNRAEFLKMLTLASPMPFVSDRASSASKFSDVSPSDWFYPYVGNALTLSWIEGYPDGTFKPANPVNRAEALKMTFWGFNLDQSASQVSSSWSDVVANSWYYSYFNSALDKNLLPLVHTVNNSNGTRLYAPEGCMARGEVAELLYRSRSLKDNQAQTYSIGIVPGN